MAYLCKNAVYKTSKICQSINNIAKNICCNWHIGDCDQRHKSYMDGSIIGVIKFYPYGISLRHS